MSGVNRFFESPNGGDVPVSYAKPLPVTGGNLPASGAGATDRSGTATTVSGALSVAANSSRKGLVGQNLSAVNVGLNEFGGTAAIGSAGTYTVAPGQSFSVSTASQVNFIAAFGTAAVSMTEY